MKLTSYLYLLSAVSLTFATPLSLKYYNLTKPNEFEEKDLSSTILLQQELTSVLLGDTNFNTNRNFRVPNNFKESDDILIIPKSHLFEKHLNSLGLKYLVKYSKNLKLYNSNVGLDILIPEGTLPFFIFNSTDSLQLPIEQTRDGYTKFIKQSAPFKVPKLSTLVDHFLVLPIPQSFKFSELLIDKLNHGVITLSSKKLPLFKHEFSRSNSPIMVFLFKCGKNSPDYRELNASLINDKGSVNSQGFNKFFDFFAKAWAKDININQLIHGVFCTLNVNFVSQSYCIKVKNDSKDLALFPVYSNEQKRLERRQKLDIISQQHKVEKFLRNETKSDHEKEENKLNIPIKIINEERVIKYENGSVVDSFEIYSGRGKGYSQVVSNLTSKHKPRRLINLTPNSEKRSFGEKPIKADNIRDIQDKVLQRLRNRKINDKKIINSTDTYVMSKLGYRYRGNTGRSQRSKIQVAKNKLSNPLEIYDRKKSRINRGDNFIYKSARRENPTRTRSAGKEKTFEVTSYHSQGEKPEEFLFSPESQRGEKGPDFAQQDCEPVTWFNVFHHSVFGKTKFCGIDT